MRLVTLRSTSYINIQVDPSGIVSSASKPSVDISEDMEAKSTTNSLKEELDTVSDSDSNSNSDSKVDEYSVPVKSLDSSILEHDHQAFGTPVSGTLKDKDTKWLIL